MNEHKQQIIEAYNKVISENTQSGIDVEGLARQFDGNAFPTNIIKVLELISDEIKATEQDTGEKQNPDWRAFKKAAEIIDQGYWNAELNDEF